MPNINCNEYKEVLYCNYCKLCKHFDKKMVDEPCNSCLNEPINLHSHKPVKFEEK